MDILQPGRGNVKSEKTPYKKKRHKYQIPAQEAQEAKRDKNSKNNKKNPQPEPSN